MDFIANGICEFEQDIFIFGFFQNPFNKTSPCTIIDDIETGQMKIDSGVCSDNTEELLKSNEECGFYLQQQSNLIFSTVQLLLTLMCNSDTVSELLSNITINPSRQFYFNHRDKRQVAPIEAVTEFGSTIYTNINFGEFYLIINSCMMCVCVCVCICVNH